MTGSRLLNQIKEDLTRAPPVKYDAVYETKDMTTCKIQVDYDDGSNRKATVYEYHSEHGAEGFITVKRKFVQTMNALAGDAQDY